MAANIIISTNNTRVEMTVLLTFETFKETETVVKMVEDGSVAIASPGRLFYVARRLR
jgi:hypothetical protein